jgi:predicted phosphodiesterase
MKKTNLVSKIFLYLTISLALVVLSLLLMHAYMGDRHYDSGRNFFPPASQFLEPDKQEFAVAIMSDTTTNNLVLEKTIQDAQNSENNYSFIIHLGDFVMDRSRTNFYWLLWEIKPYLKDMPFYMIPGNHDVEKYGQIDKSFYRSVMGQEYYWFGYGDVLFIGMDSSGDFVEEEQFAWLSDTLTKIRPLFKYCVIFGHRPPANPSNDPGIKKNHKMDKESANKFESVIRGHKIDAMIFGHVHYFSKGQFAGIPMYTTPPAGQDIRSDIKKYGYISVKFGKNGVENVTQHYIDFVGRPREQLEAWLVSNILSQKLRKMVTIILIASSIFLLISLIAKLLVRKK